MTCFPEGAYCNSFNFILRTKLGARYLPQIFFCASTLYFLFIRAIHNIIKCDHCGLPIHMKYWSFDINNTVTLKCTTNTRDKKTIILYTSGNWTKNRQQVNHLCYNRKTLTLHCSRHSCVVLFHSRGLNRNYDDRWRGSHQVSKLDGNFGLQFYDFPGHPWDLGDVRRNFQDISQHQNHLLGTRHCHGSQPDPANSPLQSLVR